MLKKEVTKADSNKSDTEEEEKKYTDESDTEEEDTPPAKKTKTWDEQNSQLKDQIEKENNTNPAIIKRQLNIDELREKRKEVLSFKCYCSRVFPSIIKRMAHLETSASCRRKNYESLTK